MKHVIEGVKSKCCDSIVHYSPDKDTVKCLNCNKLLTKDKIYENSIGHDRKRD